MDLPRNDLDLYMLLEERGEEAFRRLHRLVRRGYVAQLGSGDVEDAIFLNHLGDGPALILYGDGKVVAMGGRAVLDPLAEEDTDRIHNSGKEDNRAFDRWLAGVREPTWRQRTRPWRETNIYTPGFAILLWGATFLVAWGVWAIWRNLW